MSNQPIIFNIRYTPYELPKNATEEERAAHKEERAFFDMTGTKNLYKYITKKEKCQWAGKNVLEYFEKTTGVFNGEGILSREEIEKMKERARTGKKNLWHGYISLNEEESPKINTPEKCMALIRSTFNSFLKDMKLNPANIDLMCALHTDRPHHLHIHFEFWEKEPKYKGKDGNPEYRKKGKVERSAIEAMFVRLGLAISDRKDMLYKNRDAAIQELRQALKVKTTMKERSKVKEELIRLSRDLPEGGRIAYASKDMEPFRERADKLVEMLLKNNAKARKADRKFYEALEAKKREIENICGYKEGKKPRNAKESGEPEYHNKINPTAIKIIEEIEADYKRRQGNPVLKTAEFIKKELNAGTGKRKYKSNDPALKRRMTISRRKISRAIDEFFLTFGEKTQELGAEYKNRLEEAEEEIRRERKKRKQAEEENYKY